MATKVQDFLKENPNYIGNANTAKRSKPKEAPKSKKGSGNQSFLSSIISELSGAGGAAGGAAAGAALGSVVPGIGNIVGGIAGGIVGGFGGGFGGRAIENKVRDNEYRLGDALKEGAVSGVFGGVGPAFQGARGLGALGKASGSKGIGAGLSALSGMSDDTAKVAGKAIVSRGAKAGKAVGQGITNVDDLAYASRKGLQATGDNLRGWQRGIVSGNNGLTKTDRLAQNKALDGVNRWFSGIGKSGQFDNADDAMKALANQYKRAPEAAKAFGKSNADDLANRFLQNLDNNPLLKGNLTAKNNKTALNLLDDIVKFEGKKNSDFVEFMSTKINPRYRTVSSGGSAGSVESQILEAFRDAGKSLIDEKLVTRSGVNKQYASLLGATKQLGKTITRDQGESASRIGVSQALSSILGPGADVAGRGLQQVGKATRVTTPLAMGALSRGMFNQATAPMPQEMPQDPMMEDPTYGAEMGDPMTDPMSQLGGGLEQPAQSAYTLEQAIADIQANPDPKSRKNIMDYYNFVSKAEKAGGTQLSAQEKKSAKQAETALMGLTQLKQLYSQAGGGQNRLPGILGNVQGKLGGNSKADSYNKIRDSLTTALARAFGETGVLTDQDREVYKQALPRLEDTPEEAQIKLQYLEDMLAQSSQAYGQTDYGTQADLSSIISQYGGM